MMIRYFQAIILSTLMMSPAWAMERPRATVSRFTQPPVLDGVLDDTCWSNATELSPFLVHDEPGRLIPERLSTSVKIGYDDHHFYVAFRCREPVLDPILNQLQLFRDQSDENDSENIFRDDYVEIFLDPGDSKGYRYFVINARGIIYDAIGGHENPETWNAGARVGVARDSHEWIVEVAIPMNALSLQPPDSGKTQWHANFCRTRHVESPVSFFSWSPSSGGFHQPACFAEIRFDDTPVAVDSQWLEMANNGRLSWSGRVREGSETTARLHVAFDEIEKVTMASRNVTGPFQLQLRQDARKSAFEASMNLDENGSDATETFLRSDTFSVRPGAEYIVSAMVKGDLTMNGNEFPFFYLRIPKGERADYQSIPGLRVATGVTDWHHVEGRWKAPEEISTAELWFVKWGGSGIKGDLRGTDLSVQEADTGRELLANGDFSRGKANWQIATQLANGYGAGASRMSAVFDLADAQGRTTQRSPRYQWETGQVDRAISTALAYVDSDYAPLTATRLALATGEIQPINFYIRCEEEQPAGVKVELLTPLFVRLLSPDGLEDALPPRTLRETQVSVAGKLWRRYEFDFGPEAVSAGDLPGWLQTRVPLVFGTVGPYREERGVLRWRGVLSDGRMEEWRQIAVEQVPPLEGRSPRTLPLHSWVYPNAFEMLEQPRARRQQLIRMQRRAGFNEFIVYPQQAEEFRKEGGRIFEQLPSVTLNGDFPGAATFLASHPEHRAVGPDGKSWPAAVSPDYLHTPNNEFLPVMAEVLSEYVRIYDHVNWDYELPLRPGRHASAVRPSQIGFSANNLTLFRKHAGITADLELSSETIFSQHMTTWLDFRHQQNAEMFRIYRQMLKSADPNVTFSAYSAYPGVAEAVYGHDWKYAAPHVDLVKVGYGGDDRSALAVMPEQHRFINSGLLIMGYYDGAEAELALTRRLQNAGSYMVFHYFVLDGRFFRGASRAARLAADFEPFFLNLRGHRVDERFQAEGAEVTAITHDGAFLALAQNRANDPRSATIRADLPMEDFIAVTQDTKTVAHGNEIELTVPARGTGAVYWLPRTAFNTHRPSTPETLPVDADPYPILRWTVPSAALSTFVVRWSEHADMTDAHETSPVPNAWWQPDKAFAPGTLYWQVKSVSLNGHESNWSPVALANVLAETPIDYRRPDDFMDGRTPPVLFWRPYGVRLPLFDRESRDLGITTAFKDESRNAYWSPNIWRGMAGNQPLRIGPGETLRTRCLVRTEGPEATAQISFVFFDRNRKLLGSTTSDLFSSVHWQEQSVEVTSDKEVFVNVVLKVGPSGKAWFRPLELSVF